MNSTEKFPYTKEKLRQKLLKVIKTVVWKTCWKIILLSMFFSENVPVSKELIDNLKTGTIVT